MLFPNCVQFCAKHGVANSVPVMASKTAMPLINVRMYFSLFPVRIGSVGSQREQLYL
jgi:hypothetical protein